MKYVAKYKREILTMIAVIVILCLLPKRCSNNNEICRASANNFEEFQNTMNSGMQLMLKTTMNTLI